MRLPWLNSGPSEEQERRAVRSLHSLLEEDERIISAEDVGDKVASIMENGLDEGYEEIELETGETLDISEPGKEPAASIHAYRLEMRGNTMTLPRHHTSFDIQADVNSHYGAGEEPVTHYLYVEVDQEGETMTALAPFSEDQLAERNGVNYLSRNKISNDGEEKEEPLILYLEPEGEFTTDYHPEWDGWDVTIPPKYHIQGMNVWNLSDREIEHSIYNHQPDGQK